MIKFSLVRVLVLSLTLAALALAEYSQSTSQNYPTPVTANEVDGVIKARDIGDPRVTTYFYTFDGSQGDIFVNVVSKNFNGDIDIFIAEGLKPLSKIVIYADSSDNETGRVIYLRKPQKLILRVEGRTPNDDPAIFKLKFAGSFVAAADIGSQEPELPDVKVSEESGIRVNSVGTIVKRIPKVKSTPKPAGEVAASDKKSDEKPSEDIAEKKDETRPEAETSKSKAEERRVEVVVSENIPEARSEPAKVKNPSVARTRRRPPAKKETIKTPKPEETAAESKSERAKPAPPRAAPRRTARTVKTPPPPKTKAPDPLESIHLVILFKDGSKIEKPMSEVLRFSVDRGILTVISKDGTIGRYPILDVLKTTIE
jgi:hypothetical protein